MQSNKHGGAEVPEFLGWAMARQGKASEVSFDPNNPAASYSDPSSFSNPSAYVRISEYTKVGKELYGADWDPAAHPLDTEAIARAGGKQHGRVIIGHGMVDPDEVPSIPQLRARDSLTGVRAPIRPRRNVAEQIQVNSASFIYPLITYYICYAL